VEIMKKNPVMELVECNDMNNETILNDYQKGDGK
jgi:hypothetical protein